MYESYTLTFNVDDFFRLCRLNVGMVEEIGIITSDVTEFYLEAVYGNAIFHNISPNFFALRTVRRVYSWAFSFVNIRLVVLTCSRCRIRTGTHRYNYKVPMCDEF